MTLKSMIDWNEIVPMLPKARREELYMEAILLLANGDRAPRRNGSATRAKGLRLWGDTKEAGRLAGAGRVYKVNRGMASKALSGIIGKVWAELLKRKSDTISYAEFKALCNNKTASAVVYLWARRMIEVVP